ncbi:MAG: VCBS repeat-containing protein [Planctomycetes bacterium]|nr:VCBS repeat-containing protein [Planctomycetota bacterium]
MSAAKRISLTVAGLVALVALAFWIAPRPVKPRPPPHFLDRPADFVTDLAASEETADKAGGDVKATLMKGLRDGNWGLAASALAPDFLGRLPRREMGVERSSPGFRIREYTEADLETLGPEPFLALLKDHVSGWVAVERTTWRMFEFLLAPDRSRAYISVHFQVAGPAGDGKRGDLQATLRGELVRADAAWRVRRLGLVEGFRIDADVPPFVEITDPAGFHWNESDENRENFQTVVNARGTNPAGGLTALDWDRDGRWDILATLNRKTAVLFRNDGQGGFVREALPFTRQEECGNTTAYVDLDGDGLEEIVTGQVLSYEGERGAIGIYTRREGRWTLLPEALPFEPGPGFRSIVPFVVLPHDVDADGDLDLYIGNYSDSHSLRGDFDTLDAHDGGRDLLFINQGGLRFTEESTARGLVEDQYTLAAAFFDVDADGDPDLLQANDYGANILWQNDGHGRFTRPPGNFFAAGSAYSMGITIADYDNTGEWAIHVSNMYSHAGNRIIPLAQGMDPATRAAALGLAEGNWLFQRDPATGQWSQNGAARGIAFADWAWASVFWDADNDGDRDLFVTNGYTSHEDKKAPDY